MTGFEALAIRRDLRPALAWYVLLVDAVAVALSAGAAVRLEVDRRGWLVLGVIVACVLVYTEVSRPIEREWRTLTDSPHLDVQAVWIFASVLTLPPALTALVAVICYGYPWLRVRRYVPYRGVFGIAVAIVAAFAAKTLLVLTGFDEFPGTRNAAMFGVVVAAGVVFLALTVVLTAVAVTGSREYAHEAASVGLGVLMAWALVTWPPVVVLVVAVTLVLHWSVLTRQLRESAESDGKTGVLKPDAWRTAALAALAGLEDSDDASLLMVDVDHFKRVNDEHGHLIGDNVLRAVAQTLKSEVRTGDLVGRYGGDEFVVFLADTTGDDAMVMAERIRRNVVKAVAQSVVEISVSIGVAVRRGGGLDDLVHAADTALYEAKDGGRNRSAMSTA